MLTLEKEGRYNASEMSWHVWNPAYVRPAGMLVNFRAGEDGKVPVQAGVAGTSVLFLEELNRMSNGFRTRKASGVSAVVRRMIPNAEDARPVHINGILYVVFIRYRKRRYKQVMLAVLEDQYREVQLTYNDSRASEGNWLPFEHRGQLYVSYSLCPHRVLAVNTMSGHCTEAYLTKRTGCNKDERGSASGTHFLRAGDVVGLGHFRSIYGLYTHFFFQRMSQPPFSILHVSNEFRFFTSNITVACGNQFGVRSNVYRECPVFFDSQVQFALSLRRCPVMERHNSMGTVEGFRGLPESVDPGVHARCKRDDLLIDIGAKDQVALTILLERHIFCGFTGWCNSRPTS